MLLVSVRWRRRWWMSSIAVWPGSGCRLSLWRWEIDARPGMHLQGPQGLIDELMEIQDADVVVGVFWKRFGTPTARGSSGTEHELRRAWAAWLEQGRPEVMVYFCTRAYSPKTSDELVQWQRVLEFQQALPEQQLWWPYTTVTKFERLLREHLTASCCRGSRCPSRESNLVERGDTQRPFPLPPVLAAGARDMFVGRAEELEALAGVYAEVAGGRRRLVLLCGEPGIGKTRLAAEFALRAHEQGAIVLYGRCDEEALLALQPFVEALRHYVDACPVQQLAGTVAAGQRRAAPDTARARRPDRRICPSRWRATRRVLARGCSRPSARLLCEARRAPRSSLCLRICTGRTARRCCCSSIWLATRVRLGCWCSPRTATRSFRIDHPLSADAHRTRSRAPA